MNIYYIEQLIEAVKSSRDTGDILLVLQEIVDELQRLDDRVNYLEERNETA